MNNRVRFDPTQLFLSFLVTSPMDVLRSVNRICSRKLGRIAEYIASHKVRKLQVGAGGHYLDGWLNTDLDPRGPRFVFMDAASRFPIPDASFDYIFHEHVIEHLSHADGRRMLDECRRILKPGGRIRIATPNLTTLVNLFTPNHSTMQLRYMQWVTRSFLPNAPSVHPCFVINNAFRNWNHQFLYDAETLAQLLTSAGFDQINWRSPNQSDDPALTNIDSPARRGEDREMHHFESMIVEAVASE